jgi:hypothetical protein
MLYEYVQIVRLALSAIVVSSEPAHDHETNMTFFLATGPSTWAMSFGSAAGDV